MKPSTQEACSVLWDVTRQMIGSSRLDSRSAIESFFVGIFPTWELSLSDLVAIGHQMQATRYWATQVRETWVCAQLAPVIMAGYQSLIVGRSDHPYVYMLMGKEIDFRTASFAPHGSQLQLNNDLVCRRARRLYTKDIRLDAWAVLYRLVLGTTLMKKALPGETPLSHDEPGGHDRLGMRAYFRSYISTPIGLFAVEALSGWEEAAGIYSVESMNAMQGTVGWIHDPSV